MSAGVRALLAASIAAIGITSSPGTAHAWYFPEHVAITKDAIAQLAPEVRDVLRGAVEKARTDGVTLCASVEVGLEELPATRPLNTPMLRAKVGVDCVPFTALPALAADHSDGTAELRLVLAGQKGRELTTAATFEWRRFLDVVTRSPKGPLERMAFVHELDVDFYFIDPGYERRAQRTRSHFVDAGRSIDRVVKDVAFAGAVDNAVAQFVAHHLRSLELATHGRASEALLEHGFALHFLEDAFAAGHLVMTDKAWDNGNARIRRRHDFFDARGLTVKRATSVETCAALEDSFEVGLAPCWTTWGDGHLGVARDSSDRVHVVHAVKKAELQLAMAFDPARMLAFFDKLGEREQIALGDFFDPLPPWTLHRHATRTRTAADARRMVAGTAAALDRLRQSGPIPVVDVGARPSGHIIAPAVVATAVDPCRDKDAGADDDKDGPCGPGGAIALGMIGASILRPMLVEFPASQEDAATLEGEEAADHGLAFQLLASASGGVHFPSEAPVDVFLPGLGVSMGLAYRFGTYLPGRRNRSAIEINAGLSSWLHYDGQGNAGGHPQVTMLEQEIRWPILWEGLTSYLLPLDLLETKTAGSLIVLGGARVREVLTTPTPQLWGVDFEVIAVALSHGAGSYPLYSVSPELRLHIGFADAGIVQPSLAGRWGPTVSLTITGGYATLL